MACTYSSVARTIYLLFLPVIILSHYNATAQERCGTVEYQKLNQDQVFEKEESFENWLKEKNAVRVKREAQARTKSTYTIPVVVHVINNGEPIGVESNISDEQIISQINVLNKDFPRLNSDAINTPAMFLPV